MVDPIETRIDKVLTEHRAEMARAKTFAPHDDDEEGECQDDVALDAAILFVDKILTAIGATNLDVDVRNGNDKTVGLSIYLEIPDRIDI